MEVVVGNTATVSTGAKMELVRERLLVTSSAVKTDVGVIVKAETTVATHWTESATSSLVECHNSSTIASESDEFRSGTTVQSPGKSASESLQRRLQIYSWNIIERPEAGPSSSLLVNFRQLACESSL
jgi:hypothetical protein